MSDYVKEERPAIYHFKRAFTRNAAYGMKVQFGRTVNQRVGITIDHFELEMPGYELTANGPEYICRANEECDDE